MQCALFHSTTVHTHNSLQQIDPLIATAPLRGALLLLN